MPDTGAPWNIPYVEPSDLVRTYPAADEAQALAIAAGLSAAGFNDREVITATNASWPVPTLGNSIVKVTVIGGGGGGSAGGNGGTGGTTTFNAGGAGSVSASGGNRGSRADQNALAASLGFVSGNNGMSCGTNTTNGQANNAIGGSVTVAYIDLSGISTVNVTIGAGGTAGAVYTGSGVVQSAPSAGGRGEVIVEYAAG